jgi:16S rRNA (uracil1498-N3)-methyltransferase
VKQLLLPGRFEVGQRHAVGGDEFHYLVRVRRHAEDDRIDVVDSAGTRATACVVRVDPGSVLLEIERLHSSVSAHVPITIYQALPKGRKLDDVIRMLVQAGVARIVPMETERTVARADTGSRRERWLRVAKEAIQQSGSAPVEIGEVATITTVLSELSSPVEEELALFLHTEPLAHGALHRYLGSAVARLSLLVGPEGGFSPAECEKFISNGIEPLWLGPTVYRTEVAGFAAVAAVQLLLLERVEWQPTK